jgi:hypothetical protein
MSTNESTVDVIGRLDAAVTALASVDLGLLSDAAIEGSLVQLSMALCRVDLLLARLAETTRSRGFTIVEGQGPDIDPADLRRTDKELAIIDAWSLAS